MSISRSQSGKIQPNIRRDLPSFTTVNKRTTDNSSQRYPQVPNMTFASEISKNSVVSFAETVTSVRKFASTACEEADEIKPLHRTEISAYTNKH